MITLKAGDVAPDFTANDKDGNEITLSKLKGKKVVLYFYPKDDTPGCTKEACDFRNNYQSLVGKGFEVLGVSTDNEKSHQKFATKFSLPFPLLADTDKVIVNAYGVYGPKKFMGKSYDGITRTTFLIDETGHIQHVFTKVDTENPTKQVLEVVG